MQEAHRSLNVTGFVTPVPLFRDISWRSIFTNNAVGIDIPTGFAQKRLRIFPRARASDVKPTARSSAACPIFVIGKVNGQIEFAFTSPFPPNLLQIRGQSVHIGRPVWAIGTVQIEFLNFRLVVIGIGVIGIDTCIQASDSSSMCFDAAVERIHRLLAGRIYSGA